jgi:hypothetical protein
MLSSKDATTLDENEAPIQDKLTVVEMSANLGNDRKNMSSASKSLSVADIIWK